MMVDRFSEGLDELTKKQQSSKSEVLKCLHRIKRFSVFEATANDVIAATMDSLVDGKFIDVDNSCGYPWSNVTLTERGLQWAGLSESKGDR